MLCVGVVESVSSLPGAGRGPALSWRWLWCTLVTLFIGYVLGAPWGRAVEAGCGGGRGSAGRGGGLLWGRPWVRPWGRANSVALASIEWCLSQQVSESSQ